MIAAALLDLAVRLLPPEDRGRWRDEWLGELEHVSGAEKVRFALGVCGGACFVAVEMRRRRALLHAANATRSAFARPTAGARPPYNAGVDFWS